MACRLKRAHPGAPHEFSAADKGQLEVAKAWLGQALALDPYDGEARSLLDRMAAQP